MPCVERKNLGRRVLEKGLRKEKLGSFTLRILRIKLSCSGLTSQKVCIPDTPLAGSGKKRLPTKQGVFSPGPTIECCRRENSLRKSFWAKEKTLTFATPDKDLIKVE